MTEETNSGWEVFTAESEGRETQPICKECNIKDQQIWLDQSYKLESIDGNNVTMSKEGKLYSGSLSDESVQFISNIKPGHRIGFLAGRDPMKEIL